MASQRGLRASQEGPRASQRGLRASLGVLRASPGGGWTYGRTDGRKISPFYRTSSPIRAAAQKKMLHMIIKFSSIQPEFMVILSMQQ